MMQRWPAPPPYAVQPAQLWRAVPNRRTPVLPPLLARQPPWRGRLAWLSRSAALRRPFALPLAQPVACPPRARMQAAHRLAPAHRPYLRHCAAARWAGPIGFSVCSRMLP
ncbi:hypothetical protein WS68_12545 [Burkholderia sp. TSV86]|nr:hypothetical protein WS68_12545 [Burkholderia sp. TSV86]